MATFVLVHGGCHGGWCWERITPELERQGHKVLTPDLPGAGADKTPLRDVTLGDRGRFVADLVSQQAKPVILLGHSMGGLSISHAAEAAPDRIKALVYLAAFLLRDGDTMWQCAERVPMDVPKIILSEDGRISHFPESSIVDLFYNTTAPDWVARAVAQAGHESIEIASTPLRVSEGRFGRVPRYYIETLRDRAMLPELQRLMQRDWPCKQVFTIDSDHSPFYSHPDQLLAHLEAIAAEVSP